MSETSKTVTIPIGLEQPQPAQERERPEWAKRSLHRVHMPRTEVPLAPEWRDNGPNVEVHWRPVEPSAEPTQPYIQPQQVNPMDDQQQTQQQTQQQVSAQPPDPAAYDFYDSNDVARFHQDNGAYYQQLVDARVQAALQPHMESLTTARWERDYNSAVERYGNSENFKQIMAIALQRVLDEQGKISILEAYQQADNKDRAKPGQKYSAHLPEAFRDKKRGIGMLGRIMHHNAETGRARPFGNRNWGG